MVVPDERHGIFINIKITDSTMKLFKLFTLMAAGTMITACNNEIENLSRNADNRVMSLQTAGKAYTRFNDVTNTWENTEWCRERLVYYTGRRKPCEFYFRDRYPDCG